MKISCKTCANYKVCTHKAQHERWTALANNCPDYCTIVPTTKAALQGALEERLAIAENPRIQCDIEKTAQPDGVSYACQQAAIQSLQSNGVRMVDGIMMWVNPDTGELQKLDNQTLGQWGVTVSPRLNISERIDAQRKVDRAYAAHKAYIDKSAENHSKTQKGRSFVFVAMPKNAVQTAQPLTHIAPDMLTRLAILACHMAHDSNLLMVACRGGRKVMRKSDIESCLKLTPHKFRRFWALAVSEKNDDGKYIIGNDTVGYRLTLCTDKSYERLFQRGNLVRGRSTNAQKMYIDVLHSLYYGRCIHQTDGSCRKIAPADHRVIGRLLLLLPYLHWSTNALTWNPQAAHPEDIVPLGVTDIADILGLSVSNISREIRAMLATTVAVQVGPKMCEMHIFARHETGSKTVYTVNPSLVYFGDADTCHALMQSEWLYVK